MRDWRPYAVGSGRVAIEDEVIGLYVDAGDGVRYSNAQVDDYHLDGILRWQPPVEMRLRARFSSNGTMRGTAGFGFWNDPFAMTKTGGAKRWLPQLRLPQAVWFFFGSLPSNMALAKGVPGFGWKAATIDAGRLLAKCLLPLAPLGILACRVPWLYAKVWPLAQHILKIDEALLPVSMAVWHEYRLVWDVDVVRFYVDGAEVFCSRFSPRGPLGFVLWIDNQMMIATPQGELRGGIVPNPSQWLEIEGVSVQSI